MIAIAEMYKEIDEQRDRDHEMMRNIKSLMTGHGREAMLKCFGDNAISILTADMVKCIDHIAVSDSFMSGMKVRSIEEWNWDCSLSDHKGIVVEIDNE